ncbi:MAG: SAM-dependent methyltransferase [Clostridiales bacterium]|nr:SAM-dependent methyltransferase [Clostridiales bacterium]
MRYKKRIEKKSSRTASYTCMCRASSFLEKNKYLKSNDYIAVKLLPRLVKVLLKLKILNLKGKISPKGIYPYVIARTKYIDEIFKNAIKDGIEQVIIFGAGFDSRAIRLLNETQNVKVYEIDTVYTLQAKLRQFKKRETHLPEYNIHIPVNFDKEDIKTKLSEIKLMKSKKSLFILEGLTMYLSQESIEKTFKLIYDYSGPSSFIVFDYLYASVLRKEEKYYGEREIFKRVEKDNEKWTFGIEEGEIENFLGRFNFNLVEHLDSNKIENKYFTDENGRVIIKVNGTHCIVLAKTYDK